MDDEEERNLKEQLSILVDGTIFKLKADGSAPYVLSLAAMIIVAVVVVVITFGQLYLQGDHHEQPSSTHSTTHPPAHKLP